MIHFECIGSESLASMCKKIYFGVSSKNPNAIVDFISIMHVISEHETMKPYSIEFIKDPILRFREGFFEYIARNGMKSLLNFNITLDDITSPSMQVDDVIRIFHKFTATLSPAKNLLIIDPYFYAESGLDAASKTLNSLLAPISNQIENITVIYSTGKESAEKFIKQELERITNRSINFSNIKSADFHDRFWINPNTQKGIVIGTSLNGIGKKLALVDSLSENDVRDVLTFIKGKKINIIF